jgi:hypothetical protein
VRFVLLAVLGAMTIGLAHTETAGGAFLRWFAQLIFPR